MVLIWQRKKRKEKDDEEGNGVQYADLSVLRQNKAVFEGE